MELLNTLINLFTKKPIKITAIKTPMYKNGDVNRPANCCEVAFTNVGTAPVYVNEMVLFSGGTLNIAMSSTETDVTPYRVRFAPTITASVQELTIIFKIINQ
jgi:hypothetical protein